MARRHCQKAVFGEDWAFTCARTVTGRTGTWEPPPNESTATGPTICSRWRFAGSRHWMPNWLAEPMPPSSKRAPKQAHGRQPPRRRRRPPGIVSWFHEQARDEMRLVDPSESPWGIGYYDNVTFRNFWRNSRHPAGFGQWRTSCRGGFIQSAQGSRYREASYRSGGRR
jgi:hypothetical protein